MYKMVLLDIDGTLITSKRKVTSKTINIINELLDKDVKVVICTGRNRRLTKLVTKKLTVKVPYCCVGGTEIFDANDELIFSANLNHEEVNSVVELIKTEDCLFQITKGNGYYKYLTSDKMKKYDMYGSLSFKDAIVRKYVGMKTIKNLDVIKTTKFDHTNEIIIGGPEESLIKIKALIENKLPHFRVRDDLWENYLFVGKPLVSKAYALERLCKRFGIEEEHVIAIGDDVNDCDMLEKAGLGIAMGNAVERVKACSDDITLTNDLDGVAHALDHYVIRKNKGKICYSE